MGLGVYVLSDEDKARIQAEEGFRLQARAVAVENEKARAVIRPPAKVMI